MENKEKAYIDTSNVIYTPEEKELFLSLEEFFGDSDCYAEDTFEQLNLIRTEKLKPEVVE